MQMALTDVMKSADDPALQEAENTFDAVRMDVATDVFCWVWQRPNYPEGFRQRLFTIMPRVFFALLPVFAAIVALFYRRRNFPTALVFAVHLHAFAFVAFTPQKR